MSEFNDEELLLRYKNSQEEAARLAKRAETTEWFKGQLWGSGIRPATLGESSGFTKEAQKDEEAILAK
ncbi:MAG: hypothetical protein Q8N88_07150 [Nanoarchaeota archaeon]|nr:hypothetical protein [Nanoarchaeota archaeon]